MFTGARIQLTAWYVAVLITILLAAGLVTYLTLARSLRVEADDALQDRSNTEIQRLRRESLEADDDEDPLATVIPETPTPGEDPLGADIMVYVIGADGTVRQRPPVEYAGLPVASLIETARGSNESQLRSYDSGSWRYRVLTVPLLDQGVLVGFLQLFKSEEQHEAELRQLRNVLGGVTAAGVVLASVGGFVLAGRTLAPIRLAMQRQRDFVADASHELRTPLAVIRANVEVAMMEQGEEQRELLRDSVAEVDHMAALVSDLLTIARIDSGSISVAQESVDVSAIAGEVVKGLERIAREGQRTLGSEIDPGVTIEGDPMRLRQLVTILTENALRYNREGGSVTVTLSRERDRAVLTVADTGIGIPAEALPRVFDRFYRVDSARSSTVPGTGLGLAIARWIVDVHRGRLRIESAPDVGTKVTVTLPLAKG